MRHRLILLFVLIAGGLYGQQQVSVEDVVSAAIQKNYDVRLFENSASLALNDNRFGFGVFLPTINANGQYLKTVSNSRNLTFGNTENVFPAAIGTNTNASIQMVWTLFDGTKMFATRRRVSELAALGEVNLRNQMINTASSVITLYYNIVRQKQQLKALGELVAVSEERVKLAEKRLQVGTAGKPELLQARVDLNALRTTVIAQQTLIQQLKDQLNGTLGMSLPDVYETSDTIPIDMTLTLEMITNDIENTNRQLASSRKSIEVAEQAVKENRATRSPVINFVSAYNIINRQENEVQVTPATQRYTQSQGYNYGVQVSIPIINGMNINRLIGASKINLDRQKIIYEQQRTIVLIGVRNAFVNYDNAKRVLLIEEETAQLARENLNIALEAFKRGITTFIELRTAQQSLADAYNRLIAARYNAKISETELLRLKGTLL